MNIRQKTGVRMRIENLSKEEFLAHPHIEGFVDWLGSVLPSKVFSLKFPSSRFVPDGINKDVTGIEEVLKHYKWSSSWFFSPNSERVESTDWISTKHSLQKLAEWLKISLSSGDDHNTYLASIEVLNWGGVRGASKLMRELKENGEILSYLNETKILLAIDGDSRRKLSDVRPEDIKKYDAGLTKIHALLDDSGSPIYDSRVAAAVSLLYCQYVETLSDQKRLLSFPCGVARGKQIRNPGDLGFPRSRRFYTREVPHHRWAQAQLACGWIFIRLLERNPSLFGGEGDLKDRAHALEAAMFMVGYDLRSFNSTSKTQSVVQTESVNMTSRNQYGYVPSGHPFRDVIDEFIRMKLHNPSLSLEEFKDSMFQESTGRVLAESTKQSYCFPIKQNEFDLVNASRKSLEQLKEDSYAWLVQEFAGQGFQLPDERRHICLIDAWLVGYLRGNNRSDHSGCSIEDSLIEVGFAGTSQAARTLINVGEQVGKYFRLLGEDGRPTEEFYKFFGDSMEELVTALNNR
jgi:hypothetical protein